MLIDIAVLAVLFLSSLYFAYKYIDFSALPFDDAAMLMRYAKHLAAGQGIVWNMGEPPVDGATDFLFMVLISMLVKTGLSLELATRMLGFVSHILTGGIAYYSLRKIFNAPRLIALGTGTFLIVGTGFYYVVGYFGTTVFALFASLSWWAALSIIQNGETTSKSAWFAVFSLITGLVRPEGVLLSGFMLLAIIFIKGWKDTRRTVMIFAGVFLLIGGAYFLWRWQYFGHPLPNPYYKKGGGQLYTASLLESLANTLHFGLLLLPAYIAGFAFKKTLRRTIGFSIPILGFAASFILLSNDMNVLGRFQYITLPIAAMVCWPITEGFREKLNFHEIVSWQKRLFLGALTSLLFVVAIIFQYNSWYFKYFYDYHYTVAVVLSKYKDTGLKLATSEAGLLPLYSDLRTLDTWGLNDQWIAHHGGITTEYLEEFDPDIIVFHAYFSPLNPLPSPASGRKEQWNKMTLLLKNYAEQNGYILAACFGDTPYETEYYYVRANLPESMDIISKIRGLDYHMAWSGKRGINYAINNTSP